MSKTKQKTKPVELLYWTSPRAEDLAEYAARVYIYRRQRFIQFAPKFSSPLFVIHFSCRSHAIFVTIIYHFFHFSKSLKLFFTKPQIMPCFDNNDDGAVCESKEHFGLGCD